MSGSERSSRSAYFLRETANIVRLLFTDHRAGRLRLGRGVGVLRAAVLFRDCTCGDLVNASGNVRVVAAGTVHIGDRCQFAGGMATTELLCHEGALLSIGGHAFFNYGVSVEAVSSVRIGERCLFGSMARIRDAGELGTLPVVIGDDVWVAHGAIIEPGSVIGDGSVVGAGSVVRGVVPPRSLALGNPAVCVPLVGKRAVAPSARRSESSSLGPTRSAVVAAPAPRVGSGESR